MTTTTTNLPPLVSGKFILGNALEMGKDPLAFVYESYLKYGPVYRVKALNRKFTVFAGPELAEFMKQKGDLKAHPSPEYMDFTEALTDIRKSILSMSGKEHLKLRSILTPGFSPQIILNNRSNIVETIRTEVKKQSKNGEPVKVISLIQRLVSESLAFMLTGEKLNEVHDQIAYTMQESLKMYLARTTPKIFRYAPTFQNARKNLLAFIEDLSKQKQEEYKTNTGEEPDLMFRLYDGLKKYPGLLEEDEINLNAIIPFVGGLDTVANTTAFLLYYLLKEPARFLEPIKVEAAHILNPDKEIKLKDLKEQETLFCLQMEILRMHPIAGFLKRIAAVDFEFAGYTITKGTDILMANTCTHKMEEFFPNPDVLDLDRHKPPRNEYRQKAFAPYGFGAHKCIGNRISEVVIMFIVSALVENFEMEMEPKNWDLKVRHIPTLCPTDDFKIKFTDKKG